MAEKTKTNEAKISIKVMADKVNKRVVYAEADHTFVDILFSFVTLPMGTIVRLLRKHDDKKFEALGSLNNLYQSLKDFPENYLETEECKYILLNPRSRAYDHCRYLKVNIDDTEPFNYFECEGCCKLLPRSLSTCNKVNCVRCGKLMKKEVGYEKSDDLYSGTSVFASDIATFIVTDDLCILPYTSATSIQLLTDYGVTRKSDLEEINLDMDSEKVLCVLKMALSLESVLTCLVFQTTHSVRDLLIPSKTVTLHLSCYSRKEYKHLDSEMRLEISLQKSTGKLLFAEAKHYFVEFLFGFLSIPLGTVIGHLIEGGSISCMNNILKSISEMRVNIIDCILNSKEACIYLRSGAILLEPHIGQQYLSENRLFHLEGTGFHYDRSELQDPGIGGSFLRQCGMFTVTDDLIIKPSSSFSTMKVLNDLQVPFDDVEKRDIRIGLPEGRKILKACLTSCSTLTDSLEHELKNKSEQ
ncbi:hypothetical protein SSX86_007463 [Deinandra increscens subsp. villosa]|uniref:DUF674 family protein n=1 Tax=Deinandra increscens subsp. villosa TaxID=3103831 RepID=A0AAP0H7X9_9ASTR